MSQDSVRRRRLKNVILDYIAKLDTHEAAEIVKQQYETADNMTDMQAALAILADSELEQRDAALDDFYAKWKSDPLVLDKWFAVQAASRRRDTVELVQDLSTHNDFLLTNPNRVRSLLSTFSTNQARFHQIDGHGYRLIADHVRKIDKQNPQLAARLAGSFNDYRRFDRTRQELIRTELSAITAHDGLSKDVQEIVKRALAF
jgi:aminopeptidase N